MNELALNNLLSPFQSEILAAQRKALFLRETSGKTCAPGDTRLCGPFDRPADKFPPLPRTKELFDSPYDGLCFWLQLSLKDIPIEVRQPEWPTEGVVWVFLDLSDPDLRWHVSVYFDPRPVEEIPWAEVHEKPRLDCSLGKTFPPSIHQITDPLTVEYEEWAMSAHEAFNFYPIQIGGWVWPIQDDFDDLKGSSVVCALRNQSFGDAGALYLFYSSKDQGFSATIATH